MMATNEPTKFCKDCKFYRRFWLDSTMSKCGHPQAVRFGGDYLVTAKLPCRRWCSDMRTDRDLCGPDAKLWEPRR